MRNRDYHIYLTDTEYSRIVAALINLKNDLIAQKDTALLATGNLFVIQLDETKVNPFYVQAFFTSEAGVSLFRSICTGTGLPTISLDKLRKLVIPLPSLEEQNVIGNKYAATMDEVILLKRKLEKSIARMKHIYDEEV